jgi:hypothetical protein
LPIALLRKGDQVCSDCRKRKLLGLLIKAGPIEIGRLLQNRQRFCVPIYQRHYVWTRQKQWEPFWNDIRTKAIECLAGRERRFSHFMGRSFWRLAAAFLRDEWPHSKLSMVSKG